MDTLDVRILRRLFQGRAYTSKGSALRESLATIAKAIDVDEDTVRNRLRKIQESGFIPEWRLYLNPQLWGGGQIAIWADSGPETVKREVVERLRAVPGVLMVYVCYDGFLVFQEFDDEWSLPRMVERIRSALEARQVLLARVSFPKGPIDLRDRDWDLIRAMHGNPWTPNAEIAAAVGLSGRTTRTRLARIFAQGVLFAWPSMDFRVIQGTIPAHLLAWYPMERKTEVDVALASHLEPLLWNVIHMQPYRRGDLTPCCYNLMVPSVPEAQEAARWTRGLPGVDHATVHLHEDVHNFFGAYDARLEERLACLPGSRFVVGEGGGRNHYRSNAMA